MRCEVCGSLESVSRLRSLPEGRAEPSTYIVTLCRACLSKAGVQSLFRILTHPRISS